MSQNVKVKFQKARDYRVVAATGVWGGVTTNGSIKADFLVESQPNPTEMEIEVSDDGRQSEVARDGVEVDGLPILIRETQIGVILSAADAFSIGAWLMERAVQAGFTPPEQPENEVH